MTNEDLSAAVARAMGWELRETAHGPRWHTGETWADWDDVPWSPDRWSPCTRWDHAGLVLEWLNSQQHPEEHYFAYHVTLECRTGQYHCEIRTFPDLREITAEADSGPLAICRA